jgi:hypothetical protein
MGGGGCRAPPKKITEASIPCVSYEFPNNSKMTWISINYSNKYVRERQCVFSEESNEY